MSVVSNRALPANLTKYQEKFNKYSKEFKKQHTFIFSTLDSNCTRQERVDALLKNDSKNVNSELVEKFKEQSEQHMDEISKYINSAIQIDADDIATKIVEEQKKPNFLKGLSQTVAGGFLLRPVTRHFLPKANMAAHHLFSGASGLVGHIKTLAHKAWLHPLSTAGNIGLAALHSPAIVSFALAGGVVAGGYGLYQIHKNSQTKKKEEDIKQVKEQLLDDFVQSRDERHNEDLLSQSVEETQREQAQNRA